MLVCVQQSWGLLAALTSLEAILVGLKTSMPSPSLLDFWVGMRPERKSISFPLIKEPVSFLASMASCLLVGWIPKASNDGDIVVIIYSPRYIMMTLTLVEDSHSTKQLAEALHTNPFNYSHEKVLLKPPFQRWGNRRRDCGFCRDIWQVCLGTEIGTQTVYHQRRNF